MTKEVSTRQIILILIISLATLKVLYLPSLLANGVGRDSYIFVFVMLMLDFFCLLIFIFLLNKNRDLSLVEILEKMFGKVFSKIILFLLMIFFLLKAFGLFQTNFSYLSENLYSSIKWYTFSVPILVAVFFIVLYGSNVLARLSEVFAYFIVIGFFVALVVGVPKADYTNLLPVLESGVIAKFENIITFSFWFGDYLIFIVFFGKIKLNRKFCVKVSTIAFVAILFITFFIATSYSLFSYNSVSHTNSISDFLQVLPSTSDTGSFDWLLILVWDIALILDTCYSIYCADFCFRGAFLIKRNYFSVALMLVAIFIPSIMINFDINTGINFVKDFASYFCFGLEFGLPLLMLIFSFRLKGEKQKNV